MQKLIDANKLWDAYHDLDYDFYEAMDNASTVLMIPDQPTNGDMIKVMFPDFEVTIVGDTVYLERYEPYCKMQFHRDWWNALYKRGDK